MLKKDLRKLIRWLESEDYEDFSDNFTTFERRFKYINEKFNNQESLTLDTVRRLVAEMYCSAGCDCCRDTKEWDRTTDELADLLEIPAYEDGSGFDFYKVRNEYREKEPLLE